MADSQNTAVGLVRVSGAISDTVRFDLKLVMPFTRRSNSEETRRAYRRVVIEFFRHFRLRHPAGITSDDVRGWRDHLLRAKKSKATVVFNLSVIRSMYEYLRGAAIRRAYPARDVRSAGTRALLQDSLFRERLPAAPSNGARRRTRGCESSFL